MLELVAAGALLAIICYFNYSRRFAYIGAD